ncbi:unnamed protein product [Protopolystoma xenopodis]|uniref:Uncharacterized protein n=1 Tax=Protopolystoma xenopodis TaxID=117903 RepID=A0A448WKP1_9PLAT|nr:unnamed protein product [Protopolystoma xenopodis]
MNEAGFSDGHFRPKRGPKERERGDRVLAQAERLDWQVVGAPARREEWGQLAGGHDEWKKCQMVSGVARVIETTHMTISGGAFRTFAAVTGAGGSAMAFTITAAVGVVVVVVVVVIVVVVVVVVVVAVSEQTVFPNSASDEEMVRPGLHMVTLNTSMPVRRQPPAPPSGRVWSEGSEGWRSQEGIRPRGPRGGDETGTIGCSPTGSVCSTSPTNGYIPLGRLVTPTAADSVDCTISAEMIERIHNHVCTHSVPMPKVDVYPHPHR